MATKKTKAEADKAAATEAEGTEEAEYDGSKAATGWDALPPIDKFSASQTNPNTPAAAELSKVNEYEAVPDEVKKGSVKPYYNDEIDVDSADSRIIPIAPDGTPVDAEEADDKK